jgi:hypothetical protein
MDPVLPVSDRRACGERRRVALALGIRRLWRVVGGDSRGHQPAHSDQVVRRRRVRLGPATGTAEVEQAEQMPSALSQEPAGRTGHRPVGADKLYDQHGFVHTARALAYAPHVAQLVTAKRGSRIDARTTRHPGYAESQRRRKLVEESFGWGKVVGLLRKLRHRGVAVVDAVFTFTMGIYNLVRIRTLTETGVCA